VKKQTAMLVDFLDALGIPNENGVVEDLPANVDDAKLKSAVDGLLAKHPPEAVAVYLNAFNDMNEANWTSLKQLLESDARLQLGAH
jgi:ABC-type sugar transport system substrate-binding protein